jgi:hypothetical protein
LILPPPPPPRRYRLVSCVDGSSGGIRPKLRRVVGFAVDCCCKGSSEYFKDGCDVPFGSSRFSTSETTINIQLLLSKFLFFFFIVQNKNKKQQHIYFYLNIRTFLDITTHYYHRSYIQFFSLYHTINIKKSSSFDFLPNLSEPPLPVPLRRKNATISIPIRTITRIEK